MITYSKGYLISELQRYVLIFSKVPSMSDIDKAQGYPASYLFIRRFGKWSIALDKAGFKSKVIRYSDEDLIAEFNRFITENNRIPTVHDMNSSAGYPSERAFVAHFKSWAKFLERMGYNGQINKIKLTGDEVCSMCATHNSDSWRFLDDKRVCRACYHQDYVHRPDVRPRILEYHRKYRAKRRRDFGYKPLNDPFDSCEYHHLHIDNDHTIGVHIPRYLHKSIWHSSTTKQNMDAINIVALLYLASEHTNIKLNKGEFK